MARADDAPVACSRCAKLPCWKVRGCGCNLFTSPGKGLCEYHRGGGHLLMWRNTEAIGFFLYGVQGTDRLSVSAPLYFQSCCAVPVSALHVPSVSGTAWLYGHHCFDAMFAFTVCVNDLRDLRVVESPLPIHCLCVLKSCVGCPRTKKPYGLGGCLVCSLTNLCVLVSALGGSRRCGAHNSY